MRVCQFRHDGKWTFIAAATQGRRIRKTNASILQPRATCQTLAQSICIPEAIRTQRTPRNFSAHSAF